jgi:hypothetical protein
VYAIVFGATRLLVGVVGFIADSSFDTGSNVQGGDLITFEVNGWHILSGIVGLALWRNARTARLYALGFGTVYLIVTIWGFVDGNSVLGLIPTTPPTTCRISRSPAWASSPASHPATTGEGAYGSSVNPRRRTRARYPGQDWQLPARGVRLDSGLRHVAERSARRDPQRRR